MAYPSVENSSYERLTLGFCTDLHSLGTRFFTLPVYLPYSNKTLYSISECWKYVNAGNTIAGVFRGSWCRGPRNIVKWEILSTLIQNLRPVNNWHVIFRRDWVWWPFLNTPIWCSKHTAGAEYPARNHYSTQKSHVGHRNCTWLHFNTNFYIQCR